MPDANPDPAPAPRKPDAAPRSAKPRALGGWSAPRGYPESVVRLMDELAKLPGVGRRSAERLAFHVLKSSTDQALALARAIEDVKARVRHCRICYNLADVLDGSEPPVPVASQPADHGSAGARTALGGSICSICARASAGSTDDPSADPASRPRDGGVVMVVEQPKDLIALEQTGSYSGVYHVLMGRLSPMDGVGPGDLTIADLLARVDNPGRNAGGVPVREIVLALNPTLEGDGTTLYLAEQLKARKVSVTRLARGLPTGSQLEFASKAVLADAIEGRRTV
ncbi:MAG: recombination protein RecR [Phycisphaeraceae bacterium]|nr:recombination protein RecR [Phycisphaeraceae bacterium]